MIRPHSQCFFITPPLATRSVSTPIERPPHCIMALDQPESRYAQVEGVSVHYKLLTPFRPVNSFILALHGFGASLFSYTPLLPELQQYPNPPSLLAYDAPGFGLTQRPRKLSMYTPEFSSRIANTLAHSFLQNPEDRFILMAHSMGSLAAVRLLLANPDRISHLVLISPAIIAGGQLQGPFQLVLRLFASAFAAFSTALSFLLSPLLVPLLNVLVRPESFWRNGLQLARHPSRPLPQEILDGYRDPLTQKGWERGVLNFTRAALMDRANALKEGEDFVEMLCKLENPPPILIVHGDSDAVVPLDNSVSLAKKVHCAELVIMEKCGHVPHEEDPKEFCSILQEFLHRQRGGTGLL